MRFSFQILDGLHQATIIHHISEDGAVWATEGRKIFRQQAGKRQFFSKFPPVWPRDLFSFSRLTARAVRSDKCNLYVNKFGKILGIRGGKAYAVEEENTVELFRIQGDCVLHRSICEDGAGFTYFGEYFMNPTRSPVAVWRVAPDFSSWEKVHLLEGVRHIHGIYRDPFDNAAFWITAGDFRGECFIMRTADNFKSFEKFGDGTQIWRAVGLFFNENYICWLTDSNLEQNYACRMDRRSGALEIGQEIDASTWYGCTTQEGIYIAFTTIERGPAIQTDESSVLVSLDAFNWQKVYGFKKDFWKPVQIFKYGVISCPSGNLSKDALYLSGEGLVGLDGTSIKVKIAAVGDEND